MGDPAHTELGTPDQRKIQDGFGAAIAFELAPNIAFYEKQTGSAGRDGGDPIEQTTHRNETKRTFAPRQLVTLTPFQIVCAYHNASREDVDDLINQEGSITSWFPMGDSEDFFGYLQKVEYAPYVEGTQPEATLTIVPTNVDPSDGSEASPVYRTPSGTIVP